MKPKELRARITELEQVVDQLEREIDRYQRENYQLRLRLERLVAARRVTVYREG